ncbi:MAG: hypothetical protein V1685_04675 [Parcubacteria group bacterium]
MDSPQGQGKPNPASKTVMRIVLIIILIAAGVGIYLLMQGQETNSNSNSGVNANNSRNQNTAPSINSNAIGNANANQNGSRNSANVNQDQHVGWKTYENDILSISLLIPPGWAADTATDSDDPLLSYGDTTLTYGECGESCNIGYDVCRIGITRNIAPGVEGVEDPERFIRELPSYKGADISAYEEGGFEFYKTKVAVTPPADDGSQAVGDYILFGPFESVRYFAAALSQGFSNGECVSTMGEILNSVRKD